MKNLKMYSFLVLFIIIPVFWASDSSNASISYNPIYQDAFRNLQPGWNSETIYQTNPLSPASICETDTNKVLILDKSTNRILELELNGSVSTYLSTGKIPLDAIAFQPNANRIIGIGSRGFYVSNESSFVVIKEHPPNVTFSTLTVDPTDDSIYTGSWENNSNIYHFNANGEYISTIRTTILGVTQVAFDASQKTLYYSETFPGKITQLNITTNTTTVLASGIAIPGTGEGISIAINPQGDLFYLVAEGIKRGFYKYNGTDFEEIMGSKLGIGPISWSEKFNSILCSPGYGACIVQYDPNGTDPVRLTPTVNTRSIVEISDGSIFLGLEDTIYEIKAGNISKLITNLPFNCGNLILDGDENIYVSLMNDSSSILKVNRNGSVIPWFIKDMKGFPIALVYDSKNDLFILMTYRINNATFDIWRLPLDNPVDYSKISSIYNATGGDLTVDRSGNIYVLERSKNVIYRIPDQSSQVQVLIANVVEHAYLVHPHIAYSSKADAIILCRNDDLQVWPIDGSVSYILGVSALGIDHEGLFENAERELIGTHSGQIFKLSYSEPITSSISETTPPDETTSSTTSLASPFIDIGNIVSIFLIMVVIQRFNKQTR